jgi:hypothetical protein
MIKKPVKSCIGESCNSCDIRHEITCHFRLGELFRFYLIVLPTFIIGGIGIYNYHFVFLIIWLAILGLFFLNLEIRILCTHCPHYYDSSGTLRCWANYGAPKLWKYRAGPMNIFEKFTLILGFTIVWGYPVIFISLNRNWMLLIGYIFSVILFFTLLRQHNCARCFNFSCPLNRVKNKIREEFFTKNPLIYYAWKRYRK